MLGEIWLIFALDPKLNSAAETLPFQPGPKFLYFVVHFFEKVWFWCQIKIVPEKVYAGIWPVLEITSLNYFLSQILDVSIDQKYQSEASSSKGIRYKGTQCGQIFT